MTEVAPTAPPPRSWAAYAIVLGGVAMSLFHLYAIAIAPPEAFPFRAAHLAFAIALVFLLFPFVKSGARARPRWWDVLALLLALATCVYILVLYKPYIFERDPFVDTPDLHDKVMAVLCVVMVLEATRRILGWALPITVVLFLGYAFAFTNIEFWQYVNQLYLTTQGIFGQTLGVSAGYVLIFVLFGSFMERAGTGQLFMDFALALTGHSAGGPGKVAVVSSSLFGTISGSAVANVMIDGPITIPLMKRTGFPAHFGAAVEAVASTGGQIMPPIMGAAAFVMAEFLNVPYLQVVVWAIIPALLYYVACFAAVHFQAKRQGLKGLPREECPRLWRVLGERGHLFLPIVVILVIMFTGSSAPLAALAATASCVPLIFLRGPMIAVPLLAALGVLVAVGMRSLGGFEVSGPAVVWASATMVGGSLLAALVRAPARARLGHGAGLVVEALVDGAKNALSVALACAAAGIIIGIIELTGIGITFTQFVLALAQDTLLLALVVTAVAGIVLGMGMPTTPAYIIMVSLLVPAIAKLGVPIPAAHMFAFYFAILSAITPPVALAVYAAASLAKADLWKTGWAAVRIGAAGFIVPFMFAYEPALMLIVKPGQWHEAVIAAATATVGCIALAGGLYGYFVRACALWERAVLLAGAFLLIKPGWITDLVGLGLLAGLAAFQMLGRRRAERESPSAAG
ncbi:MAG: TRAP transporter fused permease subunit [Alphaproteobacteria bacterium]